MKNLLAFTLLLLLAAACHPAQKCVEKNKPDCICTMQYDPVCGCNNKTYGNACAAQCAGIKTFTKGECPTPQNYIKLEGLVWQVTTFAGGAQPQAVPADVTISIKLEAGKIDGVGGCNSVGGNYILDGNSLKISDMFSTKMYCENAAKWENMFLEWMPKSQSYTIEGETLTIHCGEKGNLVFRLNWKKRKGE